VGCQRLTTHSVRLDRSDCPALVYLTYFGVTLEGELNDRASLIVLSHDWLLYFWIAGAALPAPMVLSHVRNRSSPDC
jgi:hypothetical protein